MWQPPPPPPPQGPRPSPPAQMHNHAGLQYGQPQHPYGAMNQAHAMGGLSMTPGMPAVDPNTGAWIDPSQYVPPNFDMSMYQEYQMYNGMYAYPQPTGDDYDSDEDDELPISHPIMNRLDLNEKSAKKTTVEMVCDAQFNVNNVLATNILNSDYFRELFALKTFHEVIQEANKKVTHLEALTIGQTRLPSTAFCLLYKLFTLKLTVKQLCSMLSEKKPAFIRGLGLLYLRFVHPPKQLWHWFAPVLKDSTVFYPSGQSAPSMTLGEFAKKLLTELQYPGILLPRIPVPVLREYKKLILTGADSRTEPIFNDYDNEDEVAEASTITVGSLVRAQYYDDGKYYDAVIKEALPGGKYRVAFVDYDDEESEVRSSAIKPLCEKKLTGKEKDRKGKVRDIEEQIRRQERASALAHGKDYASRPASCKATMSINEHKRRRSRTPPRREREVVKKIIKAPSPPRPAPPARDPELSRRQVELLAKYGDASCNKKPA